MLWKLEMGPKMVAKDKSLFFGDGRLLKFDYIYVNYKLMM
jgi:hypothetical protein